MSSSFKLKVSISKSPIIKAAGGILWRTDHTSKGKEILLVHRPYYNDWSLPKGKVEESQNESWKGAALREVLEETGCIGLVEKVAGTTGYFVGNKPKIVIYWKMKLIEEKEFRPTNEVDALCWASLSKGLELLSYASEKNIFCQIFL